MKGGRELLLNGFSDLTPFVSWMLNGQINNISDHTNGRHFVSFHGRTIVMGLNFLGTEPVKGRDIRID
jgi:hypothetical protein